MANPFLFDEPAAEPVNPFLMNDAPAEPANPFLMDGGGMGGAMQPQANFTAPDAANPFASYAAPMYNDPNAQMGNYYYQQQQQQSAFLAQQHQQQSYASPHHQQAFVQPQQQQQQQAHSHSHNQHLQQFAGQYGTYTQVTADSFSQPAVSSAFATQQPAEQVSQAAVTASCFTAPAAPLTGAALFGVVETVEEPAIVSAPVVQEVEMVAVELPPPPPAEIIEEPAPPPPPPVPAEEDTMSLPPPPAAEVLPQVADEPLPAPPEETMVSWKLIIYYILTDGTCT